MARRVIHELIDDIDGKPADESVSFALDGMQYAIDLSARNAQRLREAVAPFVAAGTKVGRGGVTPTARGRAGRTPGALPRGDRDQNRAVREWAQRNGIDVSDRGRIKQEILDRYQAAAGR
ncbi:histone-like nucleoid-structuring protein Lsr2 [Dactylosporangium sp. McL0621]|uniref:histone-like nucleoid-structuring protein Lsr2 n=1 Tax=Dactylosporangium sp. McL0621 TaxID=3415678 RepID=UPI003CEC385B